jgi:AraC-like DNA-binding protein
LKKLNLFSRRSKCQILTVRFSDEHLPKIYHSKGIISVKELIKEFSQSRQKLNQNFLYHTKYSIKEFAVFVKIREAIKFKEENPDISPTELAHQFEYFDQSHFNRDIKRVTGVAPTLLFSRQNVIKEQLKKIAL